SGHALSPMPMLNHRLPARATRPTTRGGQTRLSGAAIAEAALRSPSSLAPTETVMVTLGHAGERKPVADLSSAQVSRTVTKALDGCGDSPRRGHNGRLWALGRNGVSFEEGEEQAGREWQNAPAILHDEHVAVAVEVRDLKSVQLAAFQLLLDGKSRNNRQTNASQHGLFDGLIAAEFQGNPQIRGRMPCLFQRFFEARP